MKLVCTRKDALDKFLEGKKIIFSESNDKYNVDNYGEYLVKYYINGIIIVETESNLNIKGLVDVTDNELYIDSDSILDNVKNLNVFIEGTDGVGKSSVVEKLVQIGYVTSDREVKVCSQILFDINPDVRVRNIINHLKNIIPGYGIFLINNSKKELDERIMKRGNISDFDLEAYEYNCLYKDTYKDIINVFKEANLYMVDCTGLNEQEEFNAVLNLVKENEKSNICRKF